MIKILNLVLTKGACSGIILNAETNQRKEYANMAQLVEHILGKDEVPGSNPGISLKRRHSDDFGCHF